MAEIAPIPDRDGHVGGVESVVVDGRRWYFGFDFSLDTVVSPLIDDPAAMAGFASRHMRQTDGAHDPGYWRELVDGAVELSDLVVEDADRTYDSATLKAQRFAPPSQQVYLLGAATAWDDALLEDETVRARLAAIGAGDPDGWDWIDAAAEAAGSGEAAVRTAAQDLLERYQRFVFERLPANWPEVFAALRPEHP